ncbi:MAG: CapA family protein [Candidatus Cloacimonetes bacterium]|nr:CapA family protein [Candidatus Cloacimonadota bacterium]
MKPLAICTFLLLLCLSAFANDRAVTIEDFESGQIELYSYLDEDEDPDAWELDSLLTYNDSDYALRLFGNTWKVEDIGPDTLSEGDVWHLACFIETKGEIHGFGLTDSLHTLFYSLDGRECLDIEEWVTTGQGAFPEGQWVLHQLPVAADFLARFDYLPTITSIVFVNDCDNAPIGDCSFDLVQDITEDLPAAPQVAVWTDVQPPVRHADGSRTVDVQFMSEVIDPDSDTHTYFWQFGDGETSDEAEPMHTYTVEDDHAYTATLTVNDDTDMWGFASCTVEVDDGDSSLPLTVNFTGDIMLARHYEEAGGIIPTLGVEAIFEPTRHMLNDADLTVVNLECPLTTYNQHHPTKTIYFKGNPNNVVGLTFAGVDMACLANNHVMDYMLPGIEETQQVLTDAGILHGGAGANSYEAYLPTFWNDKGISLAMLFSSDRTGQYNNYQPYLNAGFNNPGFAYLTPWYSLQQMLEVQDVADVVVMNWHCGSEYSTGPGADYDGPGGDWNDPDGDEGYDPLLDVPHVWDRELRWLAIDNGADAVICHHPHIIQGIEVYEGKLIAHSLGNYAFDLYYPETMPTMILKGEIGEEGFERWSIRPVFLDDYIPQPATGEMGLHILDQVAHRSRLLDTIVRVHRDSLYLYADIPLDTDMIEPEDVIIDTTLIMNARDGWWVSDPTRLERVGDISSVSEVTPWGQYEVRVGREIIWWGNMEDEGCSLWHLNSNYEDYNEDEAYRGLRSMKHQNWTGSDGITTNMEARLKCYADSMDHTIQGWIKTENAELSTIRVRFYQSRTGGYYLDQQDIGLELSGTHDWGFYWNDLDLPANTNYFDPYIFSEFDNMQPGPSWFDDISLVQWSDWQPRSAYNQIDHPNDWYWVQIRTDTQLAEATLTYTETTWDDIIVSHDNNDAPSVRATLERNRPNPFNPETTFAFSMAQPGRATLKLYNVRGRLVRTLSDESLPVGQHEVLWNGHDNNGRPVATGVYFYRLQINGHTIATRKCLLLK